MDSVRPPASLEGWLEVLPPRLRQLVQGAENQDWPFIPEEWQFDSGSDDGSVNVKDLIMSKNTVRSDMLEKDVLKECLEHACAEKDYKTAAAVAFVLDRFMYWYGTSKYVLDKVEYIRKMAPTTPIAPQVIIRKARVLKDTGAVQNAEKTLDFLLFDKRHREQWRYTDESQYERVCITCIHLKGIIRNNLGLWLESADMLFDSIVGYNNLPQHDLKGVASSVAILSDIMRNMSYADYQTLQTKYIVHHPEQPLMGAYAANRQAAWLCRFEPFFCAGHLRRAGEVLLMHAVSLPPKMRPDLLDQALHDLKRSLIAHNSVTSLASRQQLYEFIYALYQTVVAFCLLGNHEIGTEIEKYSMVIYKHYSAATGSVPLEEKLIQAVNEVLGVLDLPKLRGEGEEKKNPLLDILPYDYQDPIYREGMENTTLGLDFRVQSAQPARETQDEGFEEDLIAVDTSATTMQHGNTKPEAVDAQATTQGKENKAELIKVDKTPKNELRSEFTDRQGSQQDAGVGNEERIEKQETGSAPESQEAKSDSVASSGSDVSRDADRSRSDESGYDSTSDGLPWLRGIFADYDPDSATVPSVHTDVSGTPDDCSRVPLTFLTSDLSKPITSFVDPALSALGDEQTSGNPGTPEPKKTERGHVEGSTSTMDGISLTARTVHRARVFKYDPQQRIWTCLSTLVYVDEELKTEKKGALRDTIKLQYLNQEESRARYVGKRYRNAAFRKLKNYYQDVLCQMTARHYVALFNQKLHKNPLQGWQIQFLPAAHIQLLSDDHQSIIDVFNVEHYVEGSAFLKVTNNDVYVNKNLDPRLLDVSLAFMHFTFCHSGGKLLVTDLQGWVPQDQVGIIIFTDPAIHSPSLKCFETANQGQRGLDKFWQRQHPYCNDICRSLGLARPAPTE